jgi:hypothetical protein
MLKRDELTDPKSCLSRAGNDEPIFVIRGCDATAPDVVRFWAHRRCEIGKNDPADVQIVSALELATQMEHERSTETRAQAQFAYAAPTWFRRATATQGLSGEPRDLLLQEMIRQIPIDLLLATVVEAVDDALEQSRREKTRGDPEEIRPVSSDGEIVAVDVVIAIAAILFGVEIPGGGRDRRGSRASPRATD